MTNLLTLFINEINSNQLISMRRWSSRHFRSNYNKKLMQNIKSLLNFISGHDTKALIESNS